MFYSSTSRLPVKVLSFNSKILRHLNTKSARKSLNLKKFARFLTVTELCPSQQLAITSLVTHFSHARLLRLRLIRMAIFAQRQPELVRVADSFGRNTPSQSHHSAASSIARNLTSQRNNVTPYLAQ